MMAKGCTRCVARRTVMMTRLPRLPRGIGNCWCDRPQGPPHPGLPGLAIHLHKRVPIVGSATTGLNPAAPLALRGADLRRHGSPAAPDRWVRRERPGHAGGTPALQLHAYWYPGSIRLLPAQLLA